MLGAVTDPALRYLRYEQEQHTCEREGSREDGEFQGRVRVVGEPVRRESGASLNDSGVGRG
jgi:hypothetical protein